MINYDESKRQALKTFDADEYLPRVTFEAIHPDAKLPVYKTRGAAGADIASAESCVIPSGMTAKISTGLKIAIEQGWEVQVRSRSGLAVRGIFVTNGPGTIDDDFRGEVFVMLTNLSGDYLAIEPGDRIAQLVLAPVYRAAFKWGRVDETETERGAGGYGSTGV